MKKRGHGSRIALLFATSLVALGAATVWTFMIPHPTDEPRLGSLGPASAREEIVAAARAGHISSHWRGGEARPILDPTRFRGQVFMGLDVEAGYRAASEIPDVLDELFCYCYCEIGHEPRHKSLRTCFTEMHASQCTVCLGEALRARELVRQGKPLPEIERTIDREFTG